MTTLPTTDRNDNTTLLADAMFESIVSSFDSFDRLAAQVLLTGPPSVGKSVIARAVADAVAAHGVADRVRILQMHPGSRHEDLIGGLTARAVDGQRVWHHLDGPLVSMADAVRGDGARRVLVLEDLHHVDVATLFGETFVLLDARDDGRGESCVHLPNGTRLSLPNELAIVATALPVDTHSDGASNTWRRRFRQLHLPASSEVLQRHYQQARNEVVDLVSGFEWMNILLDAAFGPAHTIGHGVFMVPHMTADILRQICDHQIDPILKTTARGHPVAQRLVCSSLWPSLAA
jgi:hypothetical protein